MSILLLFAYFIKNNNYKEIENLQYINNIEEFTPIKKQEIPENLKTIYKYNQIVNNIHSFSADQVKIRVNPKYNLKVNGFIYYESPNNFKFIVTGILNKIKEVDIGSNNQLFWFWSKDSDCLFYANHADFSKSLLKTPLNPKWIIETFNFNPIELNYNCEILKLNGNLAVSEKRLGTLGETVKKITLFNSDGDEIIGHYLYDINDNLIISTEIIESHKINGFKIPKKIVIQWNVEKIYLEIEIFDPKINEKNDPQHWELPNITPKINIAS